jgi:hypothetical protein
MAIKSLRAKNFMLFEDTGWLDLYRINLIYGQNSSGKSIFRTVLEVFMNALKDENNKDCFFLDKLPTPKGVEAETTFIFKFEAKSSLSGLLHPLGISDTDPDTDIYIDLYLSFVADHQKSKLKALDIQVSEIGGEEIVDIKSIFKAEINSQTGWVLSSDFLGISPDNEDWNKITLISGFIPLIDGMHESIWDIIKKERNAEDESNNNELVGSKDEIEYLYKFLNRLQNEILRLFESTHFISTAYPQSNTESLESVLTQNDIVNEISAFFYEHALLDDIRTNAFIGSGALSLSCLVRHGLSLQRDNLATIEHPEILLDNQAQLSLMDYLIRKAIDQDITLIIETHSEMMLLRLMKRIRQSTKKKLPPIFSKLKITQKDVAIRVIRKNNNQKFEILQIRLNDYGELMTPWQFLLMCF